MFMTSHSPFRRALRRSFIETLEARIAPATYRWNLTGSGNWATGASWFNETTGLANNGFPNAADDIAKFTTAATSNPNVSINAINVTVGTLIFDDDNSYSIGALNGGGLTFSAATTAHLVVTNVNGD